VDAVDVNPSPVYGDSVFAGGVKAAPVAHSTYRPAPKPAPAPQPFNVQVIRGDKVENQAFPR
jgi:hypothetical protein